MAVAKGWILRRREYSCWALLIGGLWRREGVPAANEKTGTPNFPQWIRTAWTIEWATLNLKRATSVGCSSPTNRGTLFLFFRFLYVKLYYSLKSKNGHSEDWLYCVGAVVRGRTGRN